MFQLKWEENAVKEQVAIFQYWNRHNKSQNYSKKLYKEIRRIEKLLEKNPYIGSITDFLGIRRMIILSHFSLFYRITGKEIDILSMWDNRRNPENIKF